MNTIWKGYLQEFCQKRKIPIPNYRIKKQSGPPHMIRFQVEVEVDGRWFTGDDMCPSKKDAEQSAAKKAWEAFNTENYSSIPSINVPTVHHPIETVPHSESIDMNTRYHLPDEHADLEQFIANLVEREGGRIRKIFPPNNLGRYKIEIAGSYRYCENVKGHHKKNQIYFIVDPATRTYIQKCHDTNCYGFKSAIKNIDAKSTITPSIQEKQYVSQCPSCRNQFTYQIYQHCGCCRQSFCRKCIIECEYCHGTPHCNRCFEACFDCHDS